MRRLLVAALVLIAGCALVSPAGAAHAITAAPDTVPGAGSQGAGDPYFPYQGNGGYDVASYTIAITYQPSSRALSGTVHITATATQSMVAFDLDLRHSLTATSVDVNGVPARFSQPANRDQELVIRPAVPLVDGAQFTVDVSYAGTGVNVIDPDGSLDGWIPTGDGAFVASEPQGSPTWFPVNDTPDDKATYTVSITVPDGITAVSNGVLVSTVPAAPGMTTWTWHLGVPVSSYLITATLGKFALSFSAMKDGTPIIDAVDPVVAATASKVLGRLPAILDYFSSLYGPYPFPAAGAIFDNAPQVGYELETASRPLFDRVPAQETFAHELAHQWFGDDVTLARWRDIWINEGFAEFSAWMWMEHSGAKSAAARLASLEALPASSPVWSPPPGNPGDAADIFSWSVYERGAATLEALRQKLGDPVFFQIMRGWVQAHAHGNATVPDLEAFAEHVSGRDLSAFFYNWLMRPGKPTF